jgi:hypothetical protein
MTTYIKNNTTNNKKYVFVQKNTHTHSKNCTSRGRKKPVSDYIKTPQCFGRIRKRLSAS